MTPDDWDILIPHGITPSGWGVMLDGHIFGMLTPCCGAPTSGGTCTGCDIGISYPHELTVISVSFRKQLAGWVAQVIGVPENQVEVLTGI